MDSGPPQNYFAFYSFVFLLISPHLLICDREEFYHLDKHKKLLPPGGQDLPGLSESCEIVGLGVVVCEKSV